MFVVEAQSHVCGVRLKRYRDGSERWDCDYGNFGPAFADHPMAKRSILEEWDHELRSHLARVVRGQLISRYMAMPPADRDQFTARNRAPALFAASLLKGLSADDCMPDAATANWWRDRAKRFAAAREWQRANLKGIKLERGNVRVGDAARSVATGVGEKIHHGTEGIQAGVDARLQQQRDVMELLDRGHSVVQVAQATGLNRHEVRAIIDRALRSEAAA